MGHTNVSLDKASSLAVNRVALNLRWDFTINEIQDTRYKIQRTREKEPRLLVPFILSLVPAPKSETKSGQLYKKFSPRYNANLMIQET
jgi:hypothetical protein